MAALTEAISVAPLVRDCRQRLIRGLASAPQRDRLIPYFERGKMLRAELAFLSAGAVGGEPTDAMGGAVAIELLHGASLIHDDIIDEGSERRGLPAFHREVGQSVAIAVGDYLVLHAFAALADAGHSLPADRVLQAVASLATRGKECCRGEIVEIDSGAPAQSAEAYAALTRDKTGSLFAAAAGIAAILAGGTRAEFEALNAVGLAVGVAHQINDDIEDGPDTLHGNSLDRIFDLRRTQLEVAQRAVGLLRPSRYAAALSDFVTRRGAGAVVGLRRS
jgi:geranylgeranyl pyrophosphate synthase